MTTVNTAVAAVSPRRWLRSSTSQDGAKPESRHGKALGCMYVYLTSGDILRVSDISELVLSGEVVELRRGASTVAAYPRSDVYFASRVLIPPPILF